MEFGSEPAGHNHKISIFKLIRLTVVRLGDSEASDQFTGGKTRKIFILLLLRTEFVNWAHNQR